MKAFFSHPPVRWLLLCSCVDKLSAWERWRSILFVTLSIFCNLASGPFLSFFVTRAAKALRREARGLWDWIGLDWIDWIGWPGSTPPQLLLLDCYRSFVRTSYLSTMPSSPPAVATKNRRAGLPCMLAAVAAIGIKQASAIPCAAYDGTGQVGYVFGAPYGDLSLGPDLSNPSAFVSLTNKTGRPDFSGSNTQCFVVSPARTDCSQRSLMIWLLLLPR